VSVKLCYLVPAFGELSEAASRPQIANLSTDRRRRPASWPSCGTPADLRERLQEIAPDLLAAGKRRGQWVSDALLQREKEQRAKDGRTCHGDMGQNMSFHFSDVSGIQFMRDSIGAPLFENASPTFFNSWHTLARSFHVEQTRCFQNSVEGSD
jgi:hypothetical protein